MKRFDITAISSLFTILLAFQFFQSCTPTKTESTLLADRTVCTEEDCPSPQSTIAGSLSISPDAGSYQMNVDQSDVIEIAGKCTDLGNRANKIFVEVYEGEDTSISPYIDNRTSVNCINSSVAANNNARCFWLTGGKGVVDTVAGTEYPQCFNGRFSFSIKLGKILRTTPTGQVDEVNNPRLKYLVKFQLSTADPIGQSAWNSTIVERGITKPTFSQTADLSVYSCKININAFKNIAALSNISYSANVVREFPIGGNYATEAIFPYTSTQNPPPVGAPTYGSQFYLDYAAPTGWSVSEFNLANKQSDVVMPSSVLPGVKHKIKVTAYDRKYSYTLAPLIPTTSPNMTMATPTEEMSSDELECGNQPPMLNGFIQTPPPSSGGFATGCVGVTTNQKCNFTVPFTVPGGYIEYAVVKNKTTFEDTFDFTIATGQPTDFPLCGSALGTSTVEGCYYRTFSNNPETLYFKAEGYPKNSCSSLAGNYGVAARYVDPTGQYKGAWSAVNPCNITTNQ